MKNGLKNELEKAEKTRSLPNLNYCSHVSLDGLNKTTKNESQDSQPVGWELDLDIPYTKHVCYILAGGVRPSYHVNIEHRKKTQAKVEENNAAYLSYCILGSKELLFRKRVTFALNLFKCGGMLKDYRIKSNTTDSEAEFDSGFGVETYSLIDSQTDRQTNYAL